MLNADEYLEKYGTEKAKYNENGYKILCGRVYSIRRRDYAGRTFYTVEFVKKDVRDNSTIMASKQIAFRPIDKDRIVDFADGTLIRPLKIMEDFYFRTNDRYNPVWNVIIRDWEVVQSSKQAQAEALNSYNHATEEGKAIRNVDLSLYDEDLPF